MEKEELAVIIYYLKEIQDWSSISDCNTRLSKEMIDELCKTAINRIEGKMSEKKK